MSVEGSAVAVRGAYKRYSPHAIILRGLDMTVAEATIYGLLGPSGCGKTTLLRSIVGMVRLDAGDIHVKAKKKNNVGYMPQDLGLYDYMSIQEAFQFYGMLYGMDREKVNIRGKELIEFLELPTSDRLIGTLSGGQQRRLSFAVTLIHDPDLLILDEPTVGIDPVLSAAIWERLVEMTACQRKTIIITTHYIEEARQAHMIGLMRDGVLLAEHSPSTLMVSQGCDSLEEAFLLLSQKQEGSRSNDTDDFKYPVTRKKSSPTLVDSCPFWKTNRFMAQLTKNATWLLRNMHMTMFFLLLPATIAFMCQLVLSHSPEAHRALGIVSAELTEGLETCTTQTYTGCYDYDRPFTCRFMDYMRNATLRPILFDTLEAAKEATRHNKVWGVLEFSENYTDSAVDRMQYDVFSTPDGVVETSFINAYMDMSNMWVSTFLRRELVDEVQAMIQGFLKDCDINPKLMDIPLQLNPAVYGSNHPTFLQFFIPGVLCTFSFYLSIMFTTGAIMFEKSVGLERSLVAGMTKLEVVVAHSIVQVSIAIVQELVVLAIFYGIYDNTMEGNIVLVALLLTMLQIMGLFYGLVLGLFFHSERDATNAGVGTVNALFMLGGLMWPVEGMHTILRSVIWAIPVQPAVEAYRALAMRNWNFTHPVVFKGFLSTSVWTGVFILGTIALARSNKTSLYGESVYLRDVWPTREEIHTIETKHVIPAMFQEVYARIENGSNSWQALTAPSGQLYPWDTSSTYIKNPPFFQGMTKELPVRGGIKNAHVILLLGDSVTTDHISPAGSIARNSPAARYLAKRGLTPKDFNSYGSRRGNDDVMARGTFANIRLVNKLLNKTGPRTLHIPTGEELDVFDAAERYAQSSTPLIAIVGKEYGCGSSRDWAAKGPFLLGIKAVIAESFERIHRSNLVGMGIIPLQFLPGQNADTLKLTGKETYDINIPDDVKPLQHITVQASTSQTFEVILRFDTEVDILYYKHGGILNYMVRKMLD